MCINVIFLRYVFYITIVVLDAELKRADNWGEFGKRCVYVYTGVLISP
jgi:hypothetical protein